MAKKKLPQQEPQQRVVMVCVTSQRHCEELIEMGSDLSEMLTAPLAVVSVQRPGTMDPMDCALLEYLMDVARQSGGELMVLYDDKPIPRLIEYARENQAQAIVMGRGPGGGASAVFDALTAALPKVKIIQPVRQEGTIEELRQQQA
jgi:K+-sensing histidine kinase KdpD